MRRSCDQCHGTDTQRECEQGSCYSEERQRQDEEHARYEAEEQARYEAEMQAQWESEQEQRDG